MQAFGEAMEPIIRAAAVALETRQLRRPSNRSKQPQPVAGLTEEHAATVVAATQPMPAPAVQPPIQAEQLASEKEASSPVPDPHLNVRLQIEQELAHARAQIEQDLTTARAAAERDGFAKGLEQGEEAARKEVAEQIAQLNSVASSLSQARTEVIGGAEDAIVEVVYTALCRIIGETATARGTIVSMVSQVLASFRERDKLTVRLNPQDYDLLHQAPGAVNFGATLRADASVTIGGCVVESEAGYLDARLETQLTRLCEALLLARKQRQNAEESI
jgi:flagellar assembly protein FliH